MKAHLEILDTYSINIECLRIHKKTKQQQRVFTTYRPVDGNPTLTSIPKLKISHFRCQLLDSPGPAWLKRSMLVDVEGEEGGQGLTQSGLTEHSGSGDSECIRSVPASEEHAEHKSSEENVRLPSLARELERLSREGTVSPARRIRASISCAR